MPTDLPSLVNIVFAPLVKVALMIGGLMTAAAYFVLLERWMAAWVQDRKGPNRVGIPLTKIKMFGLGQPLADGIKFITKEEYTPAHVDKPIYLIAPISILASALAVFAVIPFGSVLPPISQIPGLDQSPIPLLVAPGVDVGMVYVFALSSIAVYGVILGGWASNNKYSFLGGLRSSAQLIAYEIPMGLGILGVVLMTGSLRLENIILDQARSGVWNAFLQPLGLVVFMIAAFAEAARLPFDLPECEQELIGGYHTEYAGLKLLLFLVAEFLHMITASFLIVILFFGGWHLWGVTGSDEATITWFQAIARIVVFSAKIVGVILFFMLVRWSWPRFRFDQLMGLAWKVLLPLGLVNLVAVAVMVEYGESLHASFGPGVYVLFAISGWVVLVAAWIVAAIYSPSHDDNAPHRDVQEFDIEAELYRMFQSKGI
jgi:NADH-quinone oxidoreductase subunit H